MLKAGNISLRLLKESDLNFLYSIENDPSNHQFNKESNYFSKEIIRKYISNSNAEPIVAKQDGWKVPSIK